MPPISRLFTAALLVAAGAVTSDRVDAACLLQVTPGVSDTVPDLAGGPDELPACGNSAHVEQVRVPAHVAHSHVVSVVRFRPSRHAESRRARALRRAFGVRYPGFVRVYSNTRYTTPVAVYRGQRYTGFRKVYSGPRYAGSTRVLKANRYPGFMKRYPGFLKRYSGQRYSGFRRGYRGPRYTGEFRSTRRTRW